ncbi:MULTISPECIES: pilus assembly protein TadG-related protein [unclassified Marinovum]
MTGFTKETRTKLRDFWQDETGNATIVSVYMSLAILLTTGAAIDVMRYEAVRTKMQHVLDRAVLAAADLDQMGDPTAVANEYVAKAGVAGALTNVTVQQGSNYREVAATGETNVDTFFMRLGGINTLNAPAASTAEEKIANVEISLVLDISGSMRWNSRMENLKPAAKAFVDKVLTDESNGITTLNVVPYAGTVNPGPEMYEYFLGIRQKNKGNNGWGNGDQDAPGNSLCNNNAENAEEGAADPSCGGGTSTSASDSDNSAQGHFAPWDSAIDNVVFYFDYDKDGEYDDRSDIAHKIKDFPSSASRDVDDMFKGAVAYLMNEDGDLTDPSQFLGASIRGNSGPSRYFQVKGNLNGHESDMGPTKNNGKIPGNTYKYSTINYVVWESSYVSPNPEGVEQAPPNANTPGSCLEIYSNEFSSIGLPQTQDMVPHFHHWSIDREVMDWGWCPEDDTSIQYYSKNATKLKTFIDNIRMHDGTGTQNGMKYALALLDPATSDAVGHMIDEGLVDPQFRGRPIAWEDPETEKFIVLMTDGNVTDQYRPNDPDATKNGEVEMLNQETGAGYYTQSGKADNLQDLYAQCNLAKQNGVVIFTVAFETGDSAAEEMRTCASSDSHFFRTQGMEISEVFDTIARQINNLRLIQ